MEWWHGELYVCGMFDNCGGVTCDGIAKWTGTDRCGLPGEFANQFDNVSVLLDMTIWRDSLYVVGQTYYVDGEPFYNSVAQFIGGDAVGNCSDPVGVAEVSTGPHFSIAPNPASGQKIHFSVYHRRRTF